MLLVAGRHVVGDEDDVDIGLSDEESLHCLSVMRFVVPAGVAYCNTGSAEGPLKLFAKPPLGVLEVGMRPEYDHHRAMPSPDKRRLSVHGSGPINRGEA